MSVSQHFDKIDMQASHRTHTQALGYVVGWISTPVPLPSDARPQLSVISGVCVLVYYVLASLKVILTQNARTAPN